MILGYGKAFLGSLSPLYISGAEGPYSKEHYDGGGGAEQAEPLTAANSVRIHLR